MPTSGDAGFGLKYKEIEHPRGPGGKWREKGKSGGLKSRSKVSSLLKEFLTENGSPASYDDGRGTKDKDGKWLPKSEIRNPEVQKETPTIKAADRIRKASGKITSDDVEVFSYYQKRFTNINKGLREGKLGQTLQERVSRMDSVFDKVSLSEPLIVHRGISSNPIHLQGSTQGVPIGGLDLFKKHGVGAVFHDPGFTSTTMRSKILRDMFARPGDVRISGRKAVEIRIFLPKGAKAVPIGSLTGHEYMVEAEVLIARGSRFRILKIDERSPKENAIVWLEYIK